MHRTLHMLGIIGLVFGSVVLSACAPEQARLVLPPEATNADYAWQGNNIPKGYLTITVRTQTKVASFQKDGQDAGYAKITVTPATPVTYAPVGSTYVTVNPPHIEFANGTYFTSDPHLISDGTPAVLFPKDILGVIAREVDNHPAKLIIIDQ